MAQQAWDGWLVLQLELEGVSWKVELYLMQMAMKVLRLEQVKKICQ